MPSVNEAKKKDGTVVRVGDTGTVPRRDSTGRTYAVKEIRQLDTGGRPWLKVRRPMARGRDMEITIEWFVLDKPEVKTEGHGNT